MWHQNDDAGRLREPPKRKSVQGNRGNSKTSWVSIVEWICSITVFPLGPFLLNRGRAANGGNSRTPWASVQQLTCFSVRWNPLNREDSKRLNASHWWKLLNVMALVKECTCSVKCFAVRSNSVESCRLENIEVSSILQNIVSIGPSKDAFFEVPLRS